MLDFMPDNLYVRVRSNAYRQTHIRLAEWPFEAELAYRSRLRRDAVRAYRSGGISCERQL